MKSNKALMTLFLTVFIDLVGFGIVIPILPYYAQEYGANGWEIGWLMTSYSLMQFFCAPLWGSLSDRIGRRPVLLISIAGSVAALTLVGMASTLTWLFVGRFLAGLFGANISTAYAYVADVTTNEDRTKGMGMIGAAFGIGFIFGPAIGGVLAEYGYSTPIFFAAGLAFVNLIMAYFTLKEPPVSAEQRSQNRTKRFDPKTLRAAFSSKVTTTPILHFFLFTCALVQMEVIFAIFMKARYSVDAKEAGILLALMGTIMALVQGGLIRPLSKRFSPQSLVQSGTLICAVSLILFASTGNYSFAVAMLCLMAVGHGTTHPSLSSLTSMNADPSQKGLVMGVFHSASSLARVVAPLAAGWSYDHLSMEAPYFIGTGLLILAVLSTQMRLTRQ